MKFAYIKDTKGHAMIKQGIVNFFKNLKYFFTPLGALALGLIFGLSVLIPGIISSVSTLANEVESILSDTTIDFSALKNSIISTVQSLDWNSPLDAIGTIINSDWLMNTLNDCVGSFVKITEVYATQFKAAVNTFTHNIAECFAKFIVFLGLGLIGGFFLTKWLIRRNIAKRNLWKFLLHSFVDSILSATLVATCVWLLSVWKPSIFISSVISVLLFGFISLLEAYIVHAWKKTDIKRIVNVKKIFQLFLTDAIILVLVGVSVQLIVLLTNTFTGISVGIVLMEIAFIVISLNAESYVKTLVKETDETGKKV